MKYMRENPTVDVIIPAYKPKESFIKLIEMLERQTYPINRIIVMNTEEKYYAELMYSHSLDKVYDNIHVTHISKREFNHGRTRRDGVLKLSQTAINSSGSSAAKSSRDNPIRPSARPSRS